jgi:hypothetical protein
VSGVAALLASPRLVDVIIVAVLVEGIALALLRRRWQRGMPVREVASFLGAGLALLVALRVSMPALGAGSRPLFAAAMGVALVCHLWHVAQRWDA